jgi:regulator of extracellular matrix RemA (YlzA/DUF370 family)
MHVGYENRVPWWRVTAILVPNTGPGKRLRQEAKAAGRLLDATSGRRTRSMIITDAHQVILVAVTPETLMPRLMEAREKDERKKAAAGHCPVSEGR